MLALYVAVIVAFPTGMVIVVLAEFTFATVAVSPIQATNVSPLGGALAVIGTEVPAE